MAQSGVSPDSTLVLYGDNNNWFAAYALWMAKLYGHQDARLMNGGRKKWLAEERKALYEGKGVTANKDVVAYCRIGERSSHSWFVLKYLLGYPNVKNYDGSWTEWGSMVGMPIEKP